MARLDRGRQVEPQGQVLRVQGRRGAAPAGTDAVAAVRGVLLAAVDGARGEERLERDLRAVRGGDGLRLAGRRRAGLSRELRAAIQTADAPGHVLLFRAYRLDA